ncbi:acetate--CoA ligase family protein [bacterium]|nr:acetate--CoA ligase family protein [bacterium]
MKLREHQAKDVFARYGIPVPRGEVVTTVAEAVRAAERLGGAVVLKPQLGVKGRGKVGGIGFAADVAEAEHEAARLLGAEVRGERVSTLLVEQRAEILRELYLAVTVDYAARRPVLMASAAGGVEIERAAGTDPSVLLRIPCSILEDPSPELLAPVVDAVGAGAAAVLARLYRIFRDHEAEMVEINPLVETPAGLLAVDAVLNVNESAVARHPELQELAARIPAADPLAEEARARKWTYIDLEGDIGILSSGAGLTMTILDMITERGGTAANFLDTAQIDEQGIYDAFELLHRARPPRVWLVNIFAGLNRCDKLAEGLLAFLRDHPLDQPLVVRMVGSLEEEGHRLLRAAGIEPVTEIEDAVDRCLAVAGGGAS